MKPKKCYWSADVVVTSRQRITVTALATQEGAEEKIMQKAREELAYLDFPDEDYVTTDLDSVVRKGPV